MIIESPKCPECGAELYVVDYMHHYYKIEHVDTDDNCIEYGPEDMKLTNTVETELYCLNCGPVMMEDLDNEESDD